METGDGEMKTGFLKPFRTYLLVQERGVFCN